MSRSPRSGRAALVLASSLLTLGVAEFAARSCYDFMPSIQIGEGATRLSDEVVKAVFDSHPDLIWRLKKNMLFPEADHPFRGVISNEQRLRGLESVPLEKGPKETRILFLGDSVTFGWRLPFDETFVERTQRELRERFPGRTIRCINAGVPGYSLFQGWRVLEREGFAYQPDLVVLAFGPNDTTSWGDIGDAEQHARWQAQFPPPALRWSSLATLVQIRLSRPVTSKSATARPRLTVSEFGELMEQIREETEARRIGLAVMVVAHRKNVDGSMAEGRLGRYQSASAEIGETLRLLPDGRPALVNGAAVVRELVRTHTVDEVFFDRVHPTALTAAVLADEFVALISPWLERQIHFGK
jgi:lysophospholipase L1-like esterase